MMCSKGSSSPSFLSNRSFRSTIVREAPHVLSSSRAALYRNLIVVSKYVMRISLKPAFRMWIKSLSELHEGWCSATRHLSLSRASENHHSTRLQDSVEFFESCVELWFPGQVAQ